MVAEKDVTSPMIKFFVAFLIVNFLICFYALCADYNFDEAMQKGIAQFRHENYDEALKIFKDLRTSYPDSSLAAYYLGLTYKRMENYVEACKHLEESLQMAPKIKGALMELIDTLYRLDKVDEAKKWIKVAEEEGIRPAQAAFLKGLTLIKSEEYQDAVKAFEDAKSLDKELTQSCDYQIGMAYLKMKKFDAARDIFKGIIVLDPNTDIAQYADKYVDAIDRKLEREKPLHLALKFAFEYDSNVVLKPNDTSFVTQIEKEHDTREVWDFNGDYTLRSPSNFLSLKTGYGLRFAKHNDFGRYDYLSNSFSVQPNIALERVLVTFPTNYIHTIVDEKNYVSQVSTGNMNNILLDKSLMAQLGILYKHKDYLRPPFGNEDRTGNELTGTSGLFWFFAGNEGVVSLRYSLNKDWTKGNNWEYWGNRFSGGALIPVWDKMKLNLQGDIFLQNFNNTNTIFDQRRCDQVYSLSSQLSYEIVKNVEVQFQYTYVNDRSNVGIYQYDRHIFSSAVQCKF